MAPTSESPDPDRVVFILNTKPGNILYFVIEQEFREFGGVPPLLSYSTTIKDRRTIQQKILPKTMRQGTTAGVEDPIATVLWQCERYEVTEQGMRDTVSYDSVRHLYPPPAIWELGAVNGSRATFFLNPATGNAEIQSVTPGRVPAESHRRPLSKIGAKCQVSQENLAGMLNDLGPYWMPDGPVRPGQSWTRRVTEDMRTFGTVHTDVQCTLRRVREVSGSRIATVEISGEATLEPPPQTAPSSQPGQAQNKTQREFRIDRFTCKGTAEFDLTGGELRTLDLHRELAFVAKVESEKSGPMELQSGSAHVLKVKTGHTAPPKPIIVGGAKPPVIPDEPSPRRATPSPLTRPPAQSQPRPRTDTPSSQPVSSPSGTP